MKGTYFVKLITLIKLFSIAVMALLMLPGCAPQTATATGSVPPTENFSYKVHISAPMDSGLELATVTLDIPGANVLHTRIDSLGYALFSVPANLEGKVGMLSIKTDKMIRPFTMSVTVTRSEPTNLVVISQDFYPSSTASSSMSDTPAVVATATISQGDQTVAPSATLEPVEKSTSTVAALSSSPTCQELGGVELLSQPLNLSGENSSVEAYQDLPQNVLNGYDTLAINFNGHGLTMEEGDRKDQSAIILDQSQWFVISLSKYGSNPYDGEQTIHVPLTDFYGLADENSGAVEGTRLDLSQNINTLHVRIWDEGKFTVDITSICSYKSKP